MTLSRDTLDELRSIHGTDSTLGDEDNPPYRYTLVGSLNKLERIAEHMDEHSLSFSDLSSEKQSEFERAHGAFQWHVSELSNLYSSDVVGVDDSLELPNGNTVDLPKQATSSNKSADIPSKPK